MHTSVGDFLKRADKHLLDHDFAAAIEEVGKALELEPRNVYALAYRERIGVLRREYEEKRRREEEERRQQEESLKRIREQRIREGRLDDDEEGVHVPASEHAVEQYRELMIRAWRDGALTNEEKATLENARRELHISRTDHRRLEADVKIHCYIQAIRTAYQTGAISPVKVGGLQDLRKKYDVTPEEHLAMEGKILWELQQRPRGTTIMLIDDEKAFLDVLSASLTENGYSVLTATSPEEALKELERVIPDLILCDIRFNNSSLDGFTIYTRLRKKPEFVTVPFIFVTGLKEEKVVQEGLKVGADYFITKPFTMTTLLAAIEGKLQRYGELKHSSQ